MRQGDRLQRRSVLSGMRSLTLFSLCASLALLGCSSPKARTAATPGPGQTAVGPPPVAQTPVVRESQPGAPSPPGAVPGGAAAAVAPDQSAGTASAGQPGTSPQPHRSRDSTTQSKGTVKAPPAAVTTPGSVGATHGSQPQATPQLDLASLEQRLRDTRAIGVFTKLSLKNQVDDLLAVFRAYHAKRSTLELPELRQRYDLLLLKVLSLLQDGDPPLATAIASSREAIWGILIDPQQFAKLAKL
jgi:hypothetical protein